MSDDGNMMDVAGALYKLRMDIVDIETCRGFEPKDLHDLEQSALRIINLVRKHRSKHAT